MMEEHDKLQHDHNEELLTMQRLAHEHSRWIIKDNEKLKAELDNKRKELDLRRKQLDKLVVQNETGRRKADNERHKTRATSDAAWTTLLILRSTEIFNSQSIADVVQVTQLDPYVDLKNTVTACDAPANETPEPRQLTHIDQQVPCAENMENIITVFEAPASTDRVGCCEETANIEGPNIITTDGCS